MATTSCQQRIPLTQVYANVFPLAVTPASAETLGEALLYVFFVRAEPCGLSLQDLIDAMALLFPQYTEAEISEQVAFWLQQGVLITLQPVCRDWCANTCPVKTYAISWRLEQLPRFADLLLFLIQLAGGTRVTTPTFNRWFGPHPNMQGGVTSTKRAVMPTVCL